MIIYSGFGDSNTLDVFVVGMDLCLCHIEITEQRLGIALLPPCGSCLDLRLSSLEQVCLLPEPCCCLSSLFSVEIQVVHYVIPAVRQLQQTNVDVQGQTGLIQKEILSLL